jgi:uncharacterized membrane protein
MAKGKPPAKQHHNQGSSVKVSAAFSGPLPPPSLLAQYDEIVPGAAERIIKAFEAEVAHRHEMERSLVDAETKVYKSTITEIRTGQALAFVLSLFFLAAGTFLVHGGKQWPGTILGGTGLVGIVSAFLTSRKYTNNH